MPSRSDRPPWAGSDRRTRLPPEFFKTRHLVKERAGGRCQCTGWCDLHEGRCSQPGNHDDHIIRGDDHSLANRQWLCPDCHNAKSSREGNEARAQAQASTRRPKPKHPGLLYP